MTARHVPHPPLWRRDLSFPKTRLGGYSLGFVGVDLLLMFALGILVGVLNAAGLPNLAGYPWLITTVLFMVGAPALAAIAAGLLAVISKGERSVLVIASVLFPIIVMLGEVVVPRSNFAREALEMKGGAQWCVRALEHGSDSGR